MLTFAPWECQASKSEIIVHEESGTPPPIFRQALENRFLTRGDMAQVASIFGFRQVIFPGHWHKDCYSRGRLHPHIILSTKGRSPEVYKL